MSTKVIKNLTRRFSINCEVAQSLWKKAIGLSFSDRRRSMLFAFPHPGRWEFWMFGMRYSLLMVFIDGRKKVMDVQRARPLTPDPRTWRTHRPKKPCMYVLEVPFGTGRGFAEGDTLEW